MKRRVLPLNTALQRRVLFVLRGKLGDTIVAYATVRAYADANPGDQLTLLVRANYAPLFAREAGLRVIGFSSRLAMFAKLAWMRWFEPPFDALLVLLGFGPPVRWLGRMVRARRKIYLDGRFREVYPEWPEIPEPHLHSEPAWRIARLFAPDLAQPQWSRIPSLAALRRPARAIGIAPVSDEPRRSMSPAVVHALVAALTQRHPGYAIHVLVNPADADAKPLLRAGLPAGAQLRNFPTLATLFDELSVLEHLHSTDTGLYHLAAAMGIPVTAYFGPTQPWRNGFAAQPALTRVRIAAIGGEHCEEKGCLRPACLEIAVAAYAGARIESDIDGRPPGCLLHRHARQELERVKVDAAPPAVPVH
jgi:ADP-heptose:LPS heptosyltransferase